MRGGSDLTVTNEGQITALVLAWRSLSLQTALLSSWGYEECKAQFSMSWGSGACPSVLGKSAKPFGWKKLYKCKEAFWRARRRFSLLAWCGGNETGLPIKGSASLFPVKAVSAIFCFSRVELFCREKKCF